MADARISDLPTVTVMAATDLVPLAADVGGGAFTTSKITAANLGLALALLLGPAVITGGTVTANAAPINATQTWNNGAITFDGFKLNVTDTASAADSLLMDLQIGGVSQFKVGKAGFAVANGGLQILNAANPGQPTTTVTQWGFRHAGAGNNTPTMDIVAGAAAADQKYWSWSVDGSTGAFSLNAINDAKNSSTVPLSFTRSGTTVSAAILATIIETVTISKNSSTGLHLLSATNANTGTSAWVGISVGNNNGSARGGIVQWGSGWTTAGTTRQDGTYVFGGGAGGLTLATNTNQPLYFDQNSGEAGRIDTNRYWLLGYTSSQGSYKLQVNGDTYLAGNVVAPRFKTTDITINGGSATTIATWYNVTLPATPGYYVVTVLCNQNGYSGFCHVYRDGNANVYLAWQAKANANGVQFQMSGATLQCLQNVNSAAVLYGQCTALGAT